MIGAAHQRLTQRAAAEAELLDVDRWPLRESGELWDAARDELLRLLAELQEPTAEGSPDRSEFIQGEEVKALDAFNQGLDDSVAKALHLHGIFGDILKDLIDMAIKQAIIKPIAGALFGNGDGGGGGGGSGGGGLLGGLFKAVGSAFGHRAAGGQVVAGVPYRVGELGEETFIPSQSGRIVPNNAAIAPAGGGGTITVHVEANDYFDARVAHVSGPIAHQTSVQVVRAAAPHIARAGAVGSQQVSRQASQLGPVNS